MADTGWLNIKNVESSIGSGDNQCQTVSNVQYADTTYLRALVGWDQESWRTDRVLYEITAPNPFPPVGSILDGIEIEVYCRYLEWQSQLRAEVFFSEFWGPSANGSTMMADYHSNIYPALPTPHSTPHIPWSSVTSPYPTPYITFGGPTDRLSIPAGTTVQEFFDGYWCGNYGQQNRHGLFRLSGGPDQGDEFGQDSLKDVRICYIRFKIYYSPPPIIDMIGSASIGALLTPPILQRMKALGSTLPAAVSGGGDLIKAFADMSAAMSFSGDLAADISETGWIDSTSIVPIGVSMVPPTIIRLKNMATNIQCAGAFTTEMGTLSELSAGFSFGVLLQPELASWKELQTITGVPWFAIGVSADSADGTLHLSANIPVGISVNGDSMEVDWALYTNIPVSVSGSGQAYAYTNLYADMAFGMEIDPYLVQNVDLASSILIGALLTPGKLSVLPVPTFDARTLYVEPPGRELVIPGPGRTLYITGQQRNS